MVELGRNFKIRLLKRGFKCSHFNVVFIENQSIASKKYQKNDFFCIFLKLPIASSWSIGAIALKLGFEINKVFPFDKRSCPMKMPFIALF